MEAFGIAILLIVIFTFGLIAFAPLIFGEYQPYKKMPSDPLNNPASSTTNRRETTEVRRAYPAGPEKPQWLQGNLTYIGLVLSFIGMIGKLLGHELPTDAANAFLHWLSDNWDTIAQGLGILQAIGLAIAGWGRARINFRKS